MSDLECIYVERNAVCSVRLRSNAELNIQNFAGADNARSGPRKLTGERDTARSGIALFWQLCVSVATKRLRECNNQTQNQQRRVHFYSKHLFCLIIYSIRLVPLSQFINWCINCIDPTSATNAILDRIRDSDCGTGSNNYTS